MSQRILYSKHKNRFVIRLNQPPLDRGWIEKKADDLLRILLDYDTGARRIVGPDKDGDMNLLIYAVPRASVVNAFTVALNGSKYFKSKTAPVEEIDELDDLFSGMDLEPEQSRGGSRKYNKSSKSKKSKTTKNKKNKKPTKGKKTKKNKKTRR
jgi:hypothetical protein